MAARSISETQRVRYLLGLSSTEERERIESEYFADDDAFQKMVAAEDDLIDAYARGELVDEERRSFEMNFVRSFDGRERVQFARAFASATRPVRTGTWLKIFTSARLSQTATIATIIVLVVALAWLGIELRKTSNELRELRAESAELSKRTEALQRSSDKQTHTEEIAAPDLRAQPDKPKPRERTTTAPQRAALDVVSVGPSNTYLLTQRNASNRGSTVRGTVKDPNGKRVTDATLTLTESARNTSDTTLGNNFEAQKITQLPLDARNVVGLLALQPGTPRDVYVAARRADQASIFLNGVDVDERLNTYLLKSQHTSGNGETIFIPNSLTWFRFQLALETAATQDDYRVTIKTANGRPVTSVDWIEPVTPNQTTIDTPAIATVDLPSGDYVLVLTGKKPDGSVAKVAEYFFKIIRY